MRSLSRVGGDTNDTLFTSARAAFAASFWGAMASRLADIRGLILTQIIKMSGRKLLILRNEGKETYSCTVMPGSYFLKPMPLKYIGSSDWRIGKFTPPRSAPIKKIAVITPYYKEPDAELQRCMDSVRIRATRATISWYQMVSQTTQCGVPEVVHIELGSSHADNGNTPRYAGGLVALAQGYDGIAYLDADNWFENTTLSA